MQHTHTQILQNYLNINNMLCHVILFQNVSEVSDEELNDDLLRSDDEDVNIR